MKDHRSERNSNPKYDDEYSRRIIRKKESLKEVMDE
jgi:hypothetical protein